MTIQQKIVPAQATSRFDRVLLIAKPEMHPFFLALARLLKERHGSRLSIAFQTDDGARIFAKDPAAADFAAIHDGNPHYNRCLQPVDDEAAVYRAGKELEDWLGTNINRLLPNDRHFGRGYALGGYHHPRSVYSERTSNAQVVRAVCESLAYWRGLFEKDRPTLILSGGQFVEAPATRLGIPMRIVAGSRYKNYCYWSANGYFEAPGLQRIFASRAADTDAVADIAKPYLAHMRMRKVVGRKPQLTRTARKLAELTARGAYWRLKGYEKAKSYYFWDELGMVVRQHRDLARLTGTKCAKLDDLKGKRFVFFPLQTEPEASLQRISPEYTYQLETIATLSRDLPAGVLLAVKDTHFALGRRPSEFYGQIAEFKNVVMLDLNEYGPDVVRAADAVVVISGTPGFEGAVMGKPVVSIGRHNIFSFLDHVWQIDDVTDFRPALRWALSDEIDREKAASDGARFLAAVVDMSFDMGRYDYLERNQLDPASVEDAYQKLVASF